MIKIGKYRLNRLDKHNWVIQKKHVVKTGKREGQIEWDVIGYYKAFQVAVLVMFERVYSEGANEWIELRDVLDAINDANNKILEALSEVKKI